MVRNNAFKMVLQFSVIFLLAYMVIRLMVDPNYIADFEAYCPIGGMQAFSSFLVNNTLACSMTETQIFMGIVLIAGVIIFSKLFCKEYDPFYAVFSGFGHDVYLWYAIPVAGIILIYLITNALGAEISWVWLLAAISVPGFVLESVRLSGWILPPFKISRNKLTCTDCEECDLSCPMGLEISTVEKVNHIDCHLCGDCLHACPEKETLQIKNKEWKVLWKFYVICNQDEMCSGCLRC